MYANSFVLGKNSYDYTIYQNMLNNEDILEMTYPVLSESLRVINEKNKAELYYKFIESKKTNPFIDSLKDDVEFHIINQTKAKLQKLLASRIPPFNFSKYPNSRQLISYYIDKKLDITQLKPLAKFISKDKYPTTYKTLSASYILFPMYPFVKSSVNKKEQKIEAKVILATCLSVLSNAKNVIANIVAIIVKGNKYKDASCKVVVTFAKKSVPEINELAKSGLVTKIVPKEKITIITHTKK